MAHASPEKFSSHTRELATTTDLPIEEKPEIQLNADSFSASWRIRWREPNLMKNCWAPKSCWNSFCRFRFVKSRDAFVKDMRVRQTHETRAFRSLRCDCLCVVLNVRARARAENAKRFGIFFHSAVVLSFHIRYVQSHKFIISDSLVPLAYRRAEGADRLNCFTFHTTLAQVKRRLTMASLETRRQNRRLEMKTDNENANEIKRAGIEMIHHLWV